MAEIRLDLCGFNIDQIEQVFSSHPNLIATLRPGSYAENDQKERLRKAISAGAGLVDIEYESSDEYREAISSYARDHHCRVIISYHNYNETPDLNDLREIIRNCREYDADIIKIATTIETKADIIRVLSLYYSNDSIVAIGMGDKGKITRILAPFLGAPFTFASPDEGGSTAPGQITYSKLKSIIEALEKL